MKIVVFVIFYCKAAIMVFSCYCYDSGMDGVDLVGMNIPKCPKTSQLFLLLFHFFLKKKMYVWICILASYVLGFLFVATRNG